MSLLRQQVRPAIVMTLVLCVITGFAYPGLVTAIAQLVFPRQANGSLAYSGSRVVGSHLIGQGFTQDRYFHSRPSAAGSGYDATASSGTNKGPTDRKLADTLIAGAVASAVTIDHVERGKIPTDMVTSSGSGLDPDISPANASLQVARVARARGVPEATVRSILERNTRGRQFGFFGEPRVNVLDLNLALDSALSQPAPAR